VTLITGAEHPVRWSTLLIHPFVTSLAALVRQIVANHTTEIAPATRLGLGNAPTVSITAILGQHRCLSIAKGSGDTYIYSGLSLSWDVEMKRLRFFIVIFFIILVFYGCVGRGQYVPIDKRSLKGWGKLYFIPLGDFPSSTTEDLIAHYQSKYGLSIETRPNLALKFSVVNTARQQLIAEELIALIKNAYPDLVANTESIIIGLTTEDMYIAQYRWQFSFSWRQDGRYAVVSNARMSLGDPSEERQAARLRKMVAKNIGILYFRLQQSNDPRSVLYKDVGGISELDYMGEEF
jgi:predicted Zn-dependent protease